MSRNYSSDPILIDQLQLNDTAAFEELYHRYCFSLYSYCNGKLHSSEDAQRIVRDIFISLWEKRHELPVDFSLSLFLYTEVRKAVVRCVNVKLNENTDISAIERNIIPSFNVEVLQQAKEPVKPKLSQPQPQVHYNMFLKRKEQAAWWTNFLPSVNMKSVRYAFQRVMHLW